MNKIDKPWKGPIEKKELFVFQCNNKKLLGRNGYIYIPSPMEIMDRAEDLSKILGLSELLQQLLPHRFNGFTIIIQKATGEFGIAVCSKKDAWSRQRGLQIAYDRLLKNPYSIDADGSWKRTRK